MENNKHNVNKDEFSLDAVVNLIEEKLNLKNRNNVTLRVVEPFDVYDLDNEYYKNIPCFSADKLFEACNKQDLPDIELFKDVDDMMEELTLLLGSEPHELLASKLKKHKSVQTCYAR